MSQEYHTLALMSTKIDENLIWHMDKKALLSRILIFFKIDVA